MEFRVLAFTHDPLPPSVLAVLNEEYAVAEITDGSFASTRIVWRDPDTGRIHLDPTAAHFEATLKWKSMREPHARLRWTRSIDRQEIVLAPGTKVLSADEWNDLRRKGGR